MWDRKDGTHQIGFYDQRGKANNKPTLSKREANGTPPDFAVFLVNLAKHLMGHNVKLSGTAAASPCPTRTLGYAILTGDDNAGH
jgi:hypothetical protein